MINNVLKSNLCSSSLFLFSRFILVEYFSAQALESFLLRCPRDISSYCDQILCLTLEFLSYDPNFTDNMEEDTDEESYVEEEDEYVPKLFVC